MEQTISFNRRKVLCRENSIKELTVERAEKIKSLVNEFSRFRLKFSKSVLETITDGEIKEVLDEVLPTLIEKYHEEFGTDFKPLYPGFPAQVVDLPEQERYEIQIKIYERSMDYDDPFFTKGVDFENKENPNSIARSIEEIGRMSLEEFEKIPYTICSSGSALASQTIEELKWFLKEMPNCSLPSVIPFKENLVLVMSVLENKYVPNDITDILRYAFYTMGASPELPCVKKTTFEWETAGNSKYGYGKWVKKKVIDSKYSSLTSLPRANRRVIVYMLNDILNKKGIYNCVVDCKKHVGHWLILLKQLHVVDYKKKFPMVVEFAKKFHEERKNYRTWASAIQSMYKDKNITIDQIAESVSARPGEFLRRFDSILRRYLLNKVDTGKLFRLLRNLDGTKNKTVLELLNYYESRDVMLPRLIKSKGSTVSKSISPLEPLPSEELQAVKDSLVGLFYSNILKKYTGEELKGKTVYLDPKISEIPVPISMRGDSSLPMGTSFDIPDPVKCIRFFCHWIDESGNEDLDLHAIAYTPDFKRTKGIGWNTSHVGQFGAYSGDVRMRAGKCSEYIDIHIDKAVESGFRYVLMWVTNFEGRGLNTLDCWFGYEYLSSDKIFKTEQGSYVSLHWNPENPQFMTKSTVPGNSVGVFVFDLFTRKAILVNTSIDSISVPSTLGDKNIAVINRALKTSPINCYMALSYSLTAQGAQVVPLKLEDEEVELNEDDKLITKKDILDDYTTVLQEISN